MKQGKRQKGVILFHVDFRDQYGYSKASQTTDAAYGVSEILWWSKSSDELCAGRDEI